MYAALTLVTLLALVITVTKIKVVEAIEGTPDPRISTFKPLKQKTDTIIMYTGIIKEKPIQRHYYLLYYIFGYSERIPRSANVVCLSGC